MPCRALVSLCGILLVCTSSAADLPVRISGLPEGEVYVGQQVRFPVTVLFAERPTGSPQFSVPEAQGGILLKLPDRPVFGSEEVDGESFTSWSYDFVYYPHRAGAGTIPPIAVRAKIGEEMVSGSTEAATVNAVLPAAAKGLATLVSTTNFEVKETWQPEPGEQAMVGDAFTRTITMTAPDVLGMGFPPLPIAKPANLGVYPKSPTVNDKSARGDITGSRSETIVYVCEREGEVTLPKMVIPWYDLDSKELKTVVLAGHSISVAPNPAQQAAQEEAESVSAALDWRWIVAIVAGFVGLVIAVVRLWPHCKRCLAERKARVEASEKYLFKKLRAAAHRNDALAVVNASSRWLATLPQAEAGDTLREFAASYGGDEFQTAVDSLYTHLFGKTVKTGVGADWNGGAFSSGIVGARRQALQRKGEGEPELAPLNPSAGRTRA